MRILIGLFLVMTVSIQVKAQLGLSVSYNLMNEHEMQTQLNQGISTTSEGEPIIENAFEVGVDYKIALKNIRIEFLPQLNAKYYSGNIIEQFSSISTDADAIFAGLNLNTNIYLFDLYGNCDCPTFSKQGTFFKKGFFLQLSPGVGWLLDRYQQNETNSGSGSSLYYTAQVGAGLDIGISDVFTVTPFVAYRLHTELSYPGIVETSLQDLPVEDNFKQLQVGLRFGF